jgi:DNA-binding NarL/FixJ family response regulator
MATDKKNVMIVDDSPIIIDRLKIILSGLDNIQSIIHGESYSGAISLLASNPPDIAILDINLPDKSGIELLRYIKNHHDTITIIMLSNQSDDYYRNLCKSLGSHYFIDKSTEFEQVPLIVSSIH